MPHRTALQVGESAQDAPLDEPVARSKCSCGGSTLIGVLFVGLGNVMGKIRPNWFVGFRTPWGLNSPDVWTRTHRFGGRLMLGLGLVLIVAGLLFPAPITTTIVAVGACALAALTFGYSYVV